MVSAGGDHTRYPAGTKVTLNLISGHRHTGYTACPGESLYAQLPSIRERVAALGTPKIFRPKLSDDEIVPGQTMLSITATGSEELRWEVFVLDASGATMRVWRPRATELLVTWNGKGRRGMGWVPAGDYTVVITAKVAGTTSVARQAELPLTVPAEPEPTPSPTESPT
jgi:hypothetical protein